MSTVKVTSMDLRMPTHIRKRIKKKERKEGRKMVWVKVGENNSVGYLLHSTSSVDVCAP
jgi:hypothetical protein